MDPFRIKSNFVEPLNGTDPSLLPHRLIYLPATQVLEFPWQGDNSAAYPLPYNTLFRYFAQSFD